MPTRRFDVNKEQSVAQISGSSNPNRGNGNDTHCPTGVWSYDTTFLSRTLWRFAHDWSGMTRVTKIELHTRLTATETHTQQGSSRRLRMTRLAASFDVGGGAENSWAWGISGSVWGGPSTTGSTIDWTLTGVGPGDWVTLDITSPYAGFIPSYVQNPDGTPGQGDTNNGVRIASYDESSAARSFELFGASTGSAPYIIVTYTTNTAPGTPTLVGPANGATIAVGSQPAFSFTGYDVDSGDTIASFDIAIDDAADFATPVYFATIAPPGANHPTPQTISNWPYGGVPALAAGGTYYWRVRTRDLAGAVGPYSTSRSFVMGALPSVDTMSPAASTLADIWNLDELAVWTSGGSHAKPIVSFRYLHPAGKSMSHYRVFLYNAANTLVYDSGAVALTALPNATVTVNVAFAIINGTDFKWSVQVRDTDGNWSSFPATQTFKVRWGQGIFAQNVGAGASGLKFAAGGLTGTTAGMALAFMSSDDSAGATNPTAWVANVGSLPIVRAYVRTMVRLNTATSGQNPTLPDMTLTYNTAAAAVPDKWLTNPAGGVTLDASQRRFGYYSAMVTIPSGTFCYLYPWRKVTTDGIAVSADTDYVFSAYVKTGGSLGAGVASLLVRQGSAAGTQVTPLPQPVGTVRLTSDSSAFPDGWQRLVMVIHVPKGVTSLWPTIVLNGAVGQTMWVDGVKFEEGKVTSLWTPGFLGAAITLDALGVQIDGSEGGIFRLRGSGGGTRDNVELGANGLLFGGEATVGSPVAGALRIAPALDFPTSGASTPPANFWRQYGDANGVYFRNSAGVIFPVPFYEETSWIPTVEFATPGTPTFTYTLQVGRAIRVGKLVTAWFHVAVNPFSYTGSSGLFRVRSVPYAPASQTVRYVGPCQMRGYTKAGYDHIQTLISPADGSVYLLAGGSALTPALLTTTEVPSGSVIDIEGSITYQMA